ncbi:MAG: thrombospondin type 3 repeat-containing protein, partial [Verrucomicrobiota bacterium]
MTARSLKRKFDRCGVGLWARLLSVSLSLSAFGAASARADQMVFNVDTNLSTGYLTGAGYAFGNLASTWDTASFTLGGTMVLDVALSGDMVQSVDFIELGFDYLVDSNNPTELNLTINPGFPGEGATLDVRLPFDPDVAAGNPVAIFDPFLALTNVDAGAELGTGGDLILTDDPIFRFRGTGQYFNSPTVPDGWPLNFGPYPTPVGSSFPGAPANPMFLTGTVSLVSTQLTFTGAWMSFGRGGAGALQTAMILTGRVVATAFITAPPIPPSVAWSGVNVSGITETSAVASATVNTNVDQAIVVYDFSDRGTNSTGDWLFSDVLGPVSAGLVNAPLEGLLPGFSFTVRFYGINGVTSGWSEAATFTTVCSIDIDGDGMSDCDEIIAGTDPTDPDSVLWVSIAATGTQ